MVFFSGEKAKMKILKICEAFGANRYPFTDDFGKQMQTIEEVYTSVPFGSLFDILVLLFKIFVFLVLLLVFDPCS